MRGDADPDLASGHGAVGPTFKINNFVGGIISSFIPQVLHPCLWELSLKLRPGRVHIFTSLDINMFCVLAVKVHILTAALPILYIYRPQEFDSYIAKFNIPFLSLI